MIFGRRLLKYDIKSRFDSIIYSLITGIILTDLDFIFTGMSIQTPRNIIGFTNEISGSRSSPPFHSCIIIRSNLFASIAICLDLVCLLNQNISIKKIRKMLRDISQPIFTLTTGKTRLHHFKVYSFSTNIYFLHLHHLTSCKRNNEQKYSCQHFHHHILS